MNKFYYMLLLCQPLDRKRVSRLYVAKKILWALLAVALLVPIFFMEYFVVEAFSFAARIVLIIAALSVEITFEKTLSKARINQSAKLCEEGYENVRKLNVAHDIFIDLNRKRIIGKLIALVVLTFCVIATFSVNFIADDNIALLVVAMANIFVGIAALIVFEVKKFKHQQRTLNFLTENSLLISTLQEQLACAPSTSERARKALKGTRVASANQDKQLSYALYNKDLRKLYNKKLNQLMVASVIVGVVVGGSLGIALAAELEGMILVIGGLIAITLITLVILIFSLRLSSVLKIQKAEYQSDPVKFEPFLNYIASAKKSSRINLLPVIGLVVVFGVCLLLLLVGVINLFHVAVIAVIVLFAFFISLILILAKVQKKLVPLQKIIDETFYK